MAEGTVEGTNFNVLFPRNRLYPALLESPTWVACAETNLVCRLVRIAPKSAYLPPSMRTATVKLLRGETNEIPTPIAAAKACRSCLCPDYVPAIIAGTEGAVVLVAWHDAAVAADPATVRLTFKPAAYLLPTQGGDSSAAVWIESTEDVHVTEGESAVATLRFLSGAPQAVSAPVTHPTGDIFGEVGVVIQTGAEENTATTSSFVGLQFNYKLSAAAAAYLGQDAQEVPRLLKVPYGFEWGPFYDVDDHGHTCCSGTGGRLRYTPHALVAGPGPHPAVVVSVRLPVAKSELAGPHRHCYT